MKDENFSLAIDSSIFRVSEKTSNEHSVTSRHEIAKKCFVCSHKQEYYSRPYEPQVDLICSSSTPLCSACLDASPEYNLGEQEASISEHLKKMKCSLDHIEALIRDLKLKSPSCPSGNIVTAFNGNHRLLNEIKKTSASLPESDSIPWSSRGSLENKLGFAQKAERQPKEEQKVLLSNCGDTCTLLQSVLIQFWISAQHPIATWLRVGTSGTSMQPLTDCSKQPLIPSCGDYVSKGMKCQPLAAHSFN